MEDSEDVCMAQPSCYICTDSYSLAILVLVVLVLVVAAADSAAVVVVCSFCCRC